MPVSLGQPPAKRCKQCEDSGQNRVESGPHSWSIQLDQDLLDTIIAIYPEWFKEYSQKRTAMSGGTDNDTSVPRISASSPSSDSYAAEVDESPLQKTMDKNKESLKVKLMMRRPINQLVAQGIMPSLKTPPAFHEQRQKLERAKMGDFLKAKIQQRPDREELVRQHILEADVGHVDPSLAERQRMLKKARLADSLNDQLSHRPGPLELIKKNILHTEEPIERAIKEGVIPFKATSEGQLRKPQHPDHYITFEEDSQSSEGGGSPSNTPASLASNTLPALEAQSRNGSDSSGTKESRTKDVIETAAANAGIVNVAVTIPTSAVVVASPILQQIPNEKNQTLQTFAELCSSVVSPLSLGSSTSSLSPLSSIASPPTPLTPRSVSLSSPAPGKADKNRKKSKTKTQPKARTIKFHEYKGPPNAQKNLSMSTTSTETSYELLLQQQQLFLQWQLEWQHKYPQIILPAAQKPSAEAVSNKQNAVSNLTSATGTQGTTFLVTQSGRASTPVFQPATAAPLSPPQSSEAQTLNQTTGSGSNNLIASSSATAFKILTKLEDMKVSDLKMELKKRNLPVSGPKPQLIERLKPFARTGSGEQHQSDSSGPTFKKTNSSGAENSDAVVSEMDVTISPGELEDDACGADSPSPTSPITSAMDTSESTPPSSPNSNGQLIIQQQKKIEELQRELQKSQQQLQQIREEKDASKFADNNLTSSVPVKALLQNGLIHIDPKSQQKLILQQHLQNKIQQQQLQIHLQHPQQDSDRSSFNEKVNAKASLAAFINQQQVHHHLNNVLQGTNKGILSVVANTAGTKSSNGNNKSDCNDCSQDNGNCLNLGGGGNIDGVDNCNSNKNNSNNNNVNVSCKNSNDSNNNRSYDGNRAESSNEKNKKNNSGSNNKNKVMGRRSIVLSQEQTALVLNHLNSIKQKNGFVSHQRTSSLPTFLGALVPNTFTADEKQMSKTSLTNVKNQKSQRAASEEQQTLMMTTKPTPSEYEGAAKTLEQVDLEESKNVKSQIVDDVLEILIKNGELPPSAANDLAVLSSSSQPESLMYSRTEAMSTGAAVAATTAVTSTTASETLLPTALLPPPPPPPPLPPPSFSVTLPTSITLPSHEPSSSRFALPGSTFSGTAAPYAMTRQNLDPPTFTLSQAFISASSDGDRVTNATDAIPGNITFSITNPQFSADSSSGLHYLNQSDFLSGETADFDLSNSNDQNFHSNGLDYMLSSTDLDTSDNMLPSEYGNGDINLRELGLDLETLDAMDFSQLDCKMDVNETEVESTGATIAGVSNSAPQTSTTTIAKRLSPSPTSIRTDQLINNNPNLVKPELIEPMDMDDNWLDSLMPTTENSAENHFNSSLISSSGPGCEFLQCGDATYDSILGGGQDQFDLFDIHDSDFKLPPSSLSWDKVDFATS